MNTDKLDRNLNQALIDYSDQIRGMYAEGSSQPATEGDICELARQTFYTMEKFRIEIIKALKEK